MFGAKHQWIILGTYQADWWRVKDDSIRCSAEQLNDTIHGYLATDVLPLRTDSKQTIGRRVRNTLDIFMITTIILTILVE